MSVFSKTQRSALREVEKQYQDKCSVCGGPWHPASGQLVGSPKQVKVCGACFADEIVPLIKDRMALNMRLTSRNKKDRISFYQHAASSIIGSEPKRKKATEGVFTPKWRSVLQEARFDLDRIKADIMSDDSQTYGAYYPDDLHGSLKDRLIEIVYYGAYTAAAGRHDVTKARQKREALFALAKREKVLAAVEKAWRDGLKDGGA